MSVFSIIADGASKAFDFVNENEWAANFLAGAASAGAEYLLQKDQQKYEDRVRRETNDLRYDYASAPEMSTSEYGQGLIGSVAPMANENAVIGGQNGLIRRG